MNPIHEAPTMLGTQYAGTPTGTGPALPQYLSDADIQAAHEQLIGAFVDATAHLVAAASAYEKHACRDRHLKPRAVADALFTTRLNDFKQAAARALAACQKLKETK